MSLKLRLLLAIIPLVVIAILAMAGLSLKISIDNTETALTKSAEEKLTAQKTQTKAIVDAYFTTVESQLRSKANTSNVIDATKSFINAFNQYSAQRQILSSDEIGVLEQY